MTSTSDAAEGFTCPRCGRTTFNPNDIQNSYCGACHEFFNVHWREINDDELEIWVIYEHPLDFPNDYAVRRQIIGPRGEVWAGPEVWLRRNVDDARTVIKLCNPGAVRLERAPDDDPVIVETWI